MLSGKSCAGPPLICSSVPSISHPLLRLLQYALFNPGRGSIWYLTGMAMRQCIEYGYHHEVLQHSSNASPLEIDMKRRLFWTTYKVRH